MNRLTDKWVLITGASSGIGKACAVAFASYGCNLVIVARRADRLEKIASNLEVGYNIKVHWFEADIREKNQVAKLTGELTALEIVPDILLNNAGLASGKGKIQDGLLDDWEKMIDTNVKGLLYVTRSILPSMIEKDKGHVINIGSTAGHQVYPGGNVYNATKFAVKALSEGINLDLLGTNLRVSSVDPAMTETEFSEVRFHGDKEMAKKVYEGFKPLQAEDIADVVCYVANAPKHVNITNVVVYPTAQRNVYCIDKS